MEAGIIQNNNFLRIEVPWRHRLPPSTDPYGNVTHEGAAKNSTLGNIVPHPKAYRCQYYKTS